MDTYVPGPGKISFLHTGPTAVNKLGVIFQQKEKQTLVPRALLS